ncbi:hypothetical protein BU16DRAFT_456899 [Lophium mytilinum]|uniref:SnoaL-like domain-containing protein n=1 Tax=Lophium mytilinum TaxID=390894 RepID=A0A6A6R3H1_9PEZI|nr:hypothetical protein BU16DRAFT_456899 [Lophium mytilinum]
MHLLTTTLLLLPLLTTAIPLTTTSTTDAQKAIWDTQLAQAEYGLAHALDTKNWTALSNYMTTDIYYDSSALGAGKGGVYTSLQAIIDGLKVAWKDKLVAHNVPNSLVDAVDRGKAHVYSYLIFSQWDPKALEDPEKTYRIYEQCDDQWVLEDGKWKLKHSIVTNLGPKVEVPYFGKAE